MRRFFFSALFAGLCFAVSACGGSDEPEDEGEAGAGGDDGSGGSIGGSSGGRSPSGGSGGREPVGGTGGSEPVGGTGGSEPTGGTGGSEPTAGAGGTEPEPEPPPPSTFSCDDLDPELAEDVTDRHCFDFSDGSASDFEPDGGDWAVSDGAYVGTGPAKALTCPDAGSLITATVLTSVTAADVRVHAHITGFERADKVLVLRARDASNRIELNFRSFHDDEGTIYGGDLVIQELVDCVLTKHVAEMTIAVPHELQDILEVDVELRGDALTVQVAGETVFNDSVPISTEPGAIGFGVITTAVTRFDDLVVEVLE